jgi:uncharacterized membrane protein YjdF
MDRLKMTFCADLVRVAVLGSALVFLATGDGASALMALLVLVPSVAARCVRVSPILDLGFALALGAQAIGRPFEGGDTLPHLVLPLLSGPVLYVGLLRLGVVPRLPGVATFVGVLALGVAWELVEWFADTTLGTDYSQGYGDTAGDLFNDVLAAAASGVLVSVWVR